MGEKQGAASTTEKAQLRPDQWVESYGDFLFRFALARVRGTATAEDLVQETFLAAMKSGPRFAGRASERTWLVGIMKNKIVDHWRKASRVSVFTDLEFLKDEQGDKFHRDGQFQGAWIHELGPTEWPNQPGDGLDRNEFWQAINACCDRLPENISRVFYLREIDDMTTEEICDTLAIKPNNLWVMLHRARMALRHCLEKNWFEPSTG
jgi:RNA polymerase sigma-70 factor (TIGR02943 family)